MRSTDPNSPEDTQPPGEHSALGSAPRASHPASHAPLIVVSGPAGVGKTTIVTRLLEGTNLCLRRAITATTRGPRPGEVNGTDYHFWGEGEVLKAIDDGRMLGWAVV